MHKSVNEEVNIARQIEFIRVQNVDFMGSYEKMKSQKIFASERFGP